MFSNAKKQACAFVKATDADPDPYFQNWSDSEKSPYPDPRFDSDLKTKIKA